MTITTQTAVAGLVALTAAVAFGMFIGPKLKTAPAAVQPVAVAKPIALTGEQICARDLKLHIKFNDPDSVKINGFKRHEAGKESFDMSVSAKNAMGGYGSPTECSCVADQAADKVTYLYCAS